MAKEVKLTTYVHPKDICPARGECVTETPGEEGAVQRDNNVSILFDIRDYINKVLKHVLNIYNYSKSTLLIPDVLENALLGTCYSWLAKYYMWIQGSYYFSNVNYRHKIWKETSEFIEDLRSVYDNNYQSSNSHYILFFNYEIQKLEELYNKAKEEALEVQLVAYVTDEEHDIVEDDEYENITSNIMQALPRLGVDVFNVGLFPNASQDTPERNVTAFVTNRTYFDDINASIEMIYTTEEINNLERDKIPSLEVRMEFPPESSKCGNMYQYWFAVEPKPFYRLNFQATGGSVTAHKILILGGRKMKYIWRRSFAAAPIPGVTTSSLIIQDYFGNVLFYVVDTAEEE